MQASLSREAACLFGLHESNTVCSESEHTNSSEGCAMLALLAGWLAGWLWLVCIPSKPFAASEGLVARPILSRYSLQGIRLCLRSV